MSKWWGAAGSLRRTVEATRRSYHTIQAIPREYTGRKVSATDRLQGRIPAVVLAQDNGGHTTTTTSRSASRKQLVTTERKQIQAILNSVQLPFFCSTTFPLQIRAGSGSSTLLESGTVLPIKIHRDEESGKILNLVFVWADEGSELKVDVPVVFKGEDVCPGLKKGSCFGNGHRCLGIVERGSELRREVILVGFEVASIVKKLREASYPIRTPSFLGRLDRKCRSVAVWIHGEKDGGVSLQIVSPDALVLCVWVSLFVVMVLSALMLETDVGGTLNRIRTTLKYLCPAEHIPPKIEVDISNLDIEDKVFMHDIEVHPSLKLLSKDESWCSLVRFGQEPACVMSLFASTYFLACKQTNFLCVGIMFSCTYLRLVQNVC
ncbi:unnamed protein product [Camellia sinensis]